MSQAAAFSYTDETRRVTVHLELDGKAIVTTLSLAGEVQDRYDDEIDPRDSQRLITELFDVVPHLPMRADGTLWVSLFQGDESRDYQLSEHDLPARGLDVGRIMRMIASDTIAGYQQRSPRHMGGPNQAKMTPIGFVKWTAYFVLGFFAAVIVGLIGKIAASFVGPIAYSIAITFSLFMMEGSFWSIGKKFGEHYRGQFPVWPCAVAGSAACFAVYWQLAGVFSLFSIIWFMIAPGFAMHGDAQGH